MIKYERVYYLVGHSKKFMIRKTSQMLTINAQVSTDLSVLVIYQTVAEMQHTRLTVFFFNMVVKYTIIQLKEWLYLV